MPKYWMVTQGPEIFGKTRELGFARHAFKSTRSKMVYRIEAGDALVFYVTGKKQIAGAVRVTSGIVEESTRIWQSSKKPDELYPFRVDTEPLVELDEEQWLDAEPYHDRLEWTQRWPREHWTLAYQGQPARDSGERLRVAAGGPAGGGANGSGEGVGPRTGAAVARGGGDW